MYHKIKVGSEFVSVEQPRIVVLNNFTGCCPQCGDIVCPEWYWWESQSWLGDDFAHKVEPCQICGKAEDHPSEPCRVVYRITRYTGQHYDEDHNGPWWQRWYLLEATEVGGTHRSRIFATDGEIFVIDVPAYRPVSWYDHNKANFNRHPASIMLKRIGYPGNMVQRMFCFVKRYAEHKLGHRFGLNP